MKPARRRRAFARSVTLAGAFALCAAGEAIPQACRRTSDIPPGWLALNLGWRSTPAAVGAAEIGRRFAIGLDVSAGLEVARFDPGDFDLASVWAGATYLLQGLPLPLATCLAAAVEQERIGDLRVLSIPVGVVFGRDPAPSVERWILVPQIEPRITFRHASVRGFTRDRPAFTVLGSALFRRLDLFAGPVAEWVPSGHPEWIVHARFGVAF